MCVVSGLLVLRTDNHHPLAEVCVIAVAHRVDNDIICGSSYKCPTIRCVQNQLNLGATQGMLA